MTKKRIVVTGIGAVSPLGNTVAETWSNVLAGRSGIGPITHFDTEAFATRFAGRIKEFDPTVALEAKEARKMNEFIQYGLVASIEAINDAGLEFTDENKSRIGSAIGSGIGGIGAIEENRLLIESRGPRRVSPFFVPGSIINMISGNLSIRYGFTGPNFSVVTACTTGTHNINMAARLIQAGDADVMIVGGAENASTPVGMAGFAAARALSTRNDDPEAASRPWDKDRDGFVLSDGAATIVIEEYEFAKARGAKIYAELVGNGMSADAYHMTSPPEDGRGAKASMEAALRDAQINPEDIDYINAHGTSTPAGDKAESQACESLLGAAAKDVIVSSTKSMTGHMIGAAGAIEAIFAILSIRDQVAPPTINLDNPSEGCNLNYAPHTAQEKAIKVAMSNSFGFGGTNGSVVFRAMPS